MAASEACRLYGLDRISLREMTPIYRLAITSAREERDSTEGILGNY